MAYLMKELMTYILPGCMPYWQSAWSTDSLHGLCSRTDGLLLVEHIAWERNTWPDGMM